MATRKKKTVNQTDWIDTQEKELNEAFSDISLPIVTKGSHSTRIEYADGRVSFEIDWDALGNDVKAAIEAFESTPVQTVETKKTKTKKRSS